MPFDPAVWKAIADNGLAIVAVVVLAALAAFFIRDLVKQRDRAIAGWETQSAATQSMADQGREAHERAAQRDQLIRDLTDAVRRLEGRRSR